MPSGPWAAFQRWCAPTLGRHPRIAHSRGRALNDNYAALLEHYGLRSTRIGQSHENGVAPSTPTPAQGRHDQALILRGSRGH